MRKHIVLLLLGLFLILTNVLAQPYDVVILNGRVVDPESGLDEVRNIGVNNGRITNITSDAIRGKLAIDARGLVVSPGFIDIHAHGQTNKENEFQVHDGVTTALELEIGKPDISDWIDSRASNALINFGASVSEQHLRTEILKLSSGNTESDDQFNYLPLTENQLDQVLQGIDEELYQGGLGIGVPIEYYPGGTREEVFKVYEHAAAMEVPIFTHVRPGKLIAIQQAIADAVANNTSLHIVHINSMALEEIEVALEMITKLQTQGFDITTELYPYTAGSTWIESARFDDGWQEDQGITYSDLQWVKTGERLTEKSFNKYRKEGGVVIIHKMKPEWIDRGVQSPITIIGSDGMPYSPMAHPRSAGTFSKVLGYYVRERNLISLMEGLRKMTIMPAQRMESVAPSMRWKGRLQVGCDADITIFDPNTIIDKAEYIGGLRFSEGIKFVLVNGVLVVDNAKTVNNVFPGKPVYGKYKR